jgi:hypothetical protein
MKIKTLAIAILMLVSNAVLAGNGPEASSRCYGRDAGAKAGMVIGTSAGIAGGLTIATGLGIVGCTAVTIFTYGAGAFCYALVGTTAIIGAVGGAKGGEAIGSLTDEDNCR